MSGDEENTNQSGGRTLGGGSAEPLPESWARPSSQPRMGRIGAWGSSSSSRSGRITGLQDLAAGSGLPPRVGDDDDDDDDDAAEDQPQSFFAGGERSGISVEGPGRRGNDLVRDILKKAAQAGPPTAVASSSDGSRVFTGGGHTLGSDEVPSEFIADPDAELDDSQEETAIRNITFWRDGFSVEDGPLLRYDVPENARLLNEINTGNAPPSILNVRVGQPVELRVARRTNEDYVPSPKRPLAAFEGGGQRLGSPVPTIAGNAGTSSARRIPGAFPESSPASENTRLPAQPRAHFEVDFNEPTTSVQIRLADGTRLVARMNLSHTVGDIRNFINASYPGASSQSYTIGTTFPNRTLDDDSVTIESAGLKNCVVVQRLT